MTKGGLVGESVARVEDEPLLRGLGRFVADLHRPGEVHAAFLRSPYAHARILGLEIDRARALPGVLAVFDHRDLPPRPLPPFLTENPPPLLVERLKPLLRDAPRYPLATDRARFVGEPVAMVVADTRYIAEDALETIELDAEELPCAASFDDALARDAPLIHQEWGDNIAARITVTKGDPSSAIRDADFVVREVFTIQRQAGFPIETRGIVADLDPDTGDLMVWATTQNAHALQRSIAAMLGISWESVRVIAPDVGGGFGTKAVLYPEDVLVSWAAARLRRPVKWVEDRIEHATASIHAREQVHNIELGLSRDGVITGFRDHFLVDAGAYALLGVAIPYNTIAHLTGPYRINDFEAVATAVVTNRTPTAPYRGAGRPEAVFAMERALDRAAQGLGMDPVELRLRNLITPEELPWDGKIMYRDSSPVVLDSGDYPGSLLKVADLIAYRGVEQEKSRARERGRCLGVGFACYVEGTGVGPFEGATVRMGLDGTVDVYTGACAQGQGHQTVFAQVCADALGVDFSSVRVHVGDTKGIQYGWGTIASRSAVVAGNAIATASAEVLRLAFEVAGHHLETAPEDLEIRSGAISVKGAPERSISLGKVAKMAEPGPDRGFSNISGLQATEYYEPFTVTWANGAHAAVVEVDPELGHVSLLRYAVVHDCGNLINPMIVEGQIHGGVAQGIGAALLEDLPYSENGQPLGVTLADYLLPSATDVPFLEVEHMISPSPLNPLGIKGMGEGGAIAPPAAIAGAVEDALRPFGVAVEKTPLGPSEVLRLLARAVTDDPAANGPH
jgi:aerobic carbon-monoxide dehydrogenase large subunit